DATAELYFLIANFLTNASPCSRAAEVLREELRERKLLGEAYDWQSNARPASFEDFHGRHKSLPGDQLGRLVSQYLLDDNRASTSGGPASARSLISRVLPFGMSREKIQMAKLELAERVLKACSQLMHIRKEIVETRRTLTRTELKLVSLEPNMTEEGEATSGYQGGCISTPNMHMDGKAAPSGQESQEVLTRLALSRRAGDLRSRLVHLEGEVISVKGLKDVVIVEAREGGALRNSLSRYDGKSLPTMVSNRRVTGGRFQSAAFGGGRASQLGAAGTSLMSRMRPLFTTNGHGVFPVFCIKFDQTAQYAFTGADDCLIKV
ncbi:unnamed protein product, partial [Choristocarpus tenellus]